MRSRYTTKTKRISGYKWNIYFHALYASHKTLRRFGFQVLRNGPDKYRSAYMETDYRIILYLWKWELEVMAADYRDHKKRLEKNNNE